MQAQQSPAAATSARASRPQPSSSKSSGSPQGAPADAAVRADSREPMPGDRDAGAIEYDSWQVTPRPGR